MGCSSKEGEFKMKLKHIVLLDVETCGYNKDVYDIAWCVATKHGILNTHNYLVDEVFSMEPAPFFNEPQQKAYSEIMKITFTLPWSMILMNLWNDIKDYGINEIIAYNCNFDLTAINLTNNLIRGKDCKLFDNMQKTDLYTVFCNCMKSRKDYERFCRRNGYFTQKGFLKTSAEIAIKFIQQNTEYIECHTALNDVFDEFKIYQWILKSKKKRIMDSVNFPFRILEGNKR